MRVYLRGENAPSFADLLLEIVITKVDGKIYVSSNLYMVVATVQELIHPDISLIYEKPMKLICEHAILTLKNDQAAANYDMPLESFEGMVNTCIDTVVSIVEFLISAGCHTGLSTWTPL